MSRGDSVAVQQTIDISWPPGTQQQTHTSGVRLDGTDGQTDGRTPDSCIDPAGSAKNTSGDAKKKR